MDRLIFDRTNEDVIYAKEHQNSNEFLKGAYNYTDLNRIEEWCQFLAEKLTEYSYPVTITTKTNWTMADFPTEAQMNRIRGNIKALKDAYYSFTNLPNAKNMTYQKFKNYFDLFGYSPYFFVGGENYGWC